MDEIRALIVDDEPLARRGIAQLLHGHADVTVVGEARNGREALRALTTLQPDLVFLDVQMPGFDGFAVIRAVGPERMPAVIFVTAYDAFAVRAFETHALDYLVKPVTEARFAIALDRVRERRRLGQAMALAGRLAAVLDMEWRVAAQLPEVARNRGAPPISVAVDSGRLLIDQQEISWVEADGVYAQIHAGAAAYRIREPLQGLAQRLDPARFVRVHRSAIVNLDYVKELRDDPGGVALILRSGTRIPVSRRQVHQIKSLLHR